MIGLVMIVRDEQSVIDRCLESVRPLISSWTVVDTGSTDETKKKVRTSLKGLPGKLHNRRWKNFGHNITQALALAKGTDEWLLTLSADMTVETTEGFLTWLEGDPDPQTDAWMVEVQEANISYRLPLLVRGDLPWSYVGATHEYLDPMGRKRRGLLGLTVHHHADSVGRKDKFERDRALLESELERDPSDARTIFYLAQTLRDMGERDEAIRLYTQRASMNGWEEESWYAEYQAAKLSEDTEALIQAWRRRPWRHEPLSAAFDLASREGEEDVLFLERA